jgi:hypothetical protein
MFLTKEEPSACFYEFRNPEDKVEEEEGDSPLLYREWEATNCQKKKVKCILAYCADYSVITMNPDSFMEYDMKEWSYRDKFTKIYNIKCGKDETMVIATRECSNGSPNFLAQIFLNKFILEDVLCFYLKNGEFVDFPEEKLKQYTK